MANTNTVIQIKYSDVTAIPPSLNTAELAYSNVSNKLWINDGSGVVHIGGVYYANLIDSATPFNVYGSLVKRSVAGDFQGNIITGVDVYSRNFNLLERTNVIFAFANTIANTADDVALNHANGAYFQANAAFNKANTAPGNGGDLIINTAGAYATAANLNYNSASKTLYLDNIQLVNNVSANNINAYDKFYAGIATQLATPLPYLIAQFTGNTDPYVQVNVENIEPLGSGDYVVTSDVGTDETFYINMGIQGSQLQQGVLFPLDGYVLVQGNTGQVGGNLIIGTISGTPGQKTKIVSGGHGISNVVAEFGENLITFNREIQSNTTTRISLHANAAFDSANNVFPQVQPAFIQANAAFNAQNTTGVYANSAYLHANASYVSQNTTGVYANAAYSASNVANQRAVTSGVYANSAYLHANAAFVSANNVAPQVQPAFIQANSAFDAANIANQRAVTSGVYANSAYALANTKFASAGGTISGDVNVTGNLIVTGQTVYANTTVVNLGDAIITLNADIPITQAPTENAGIEVDRGSSSNTLLLWNETTDKWTFTNDGSTYNNIGSAAAEVYANSAFTQANTANTNAATSNQRAVTSGVYANSAYGQANTANTNASISGNYANSAYAQANTGTILAQAAFDSANNVLPQIQPAWNTANAAYTQANTANTIAYSTVLKTGDTMTGQLLISNTNISTNTTTGALIVSGGVGITGNTWSSGKLSLGNSLSHVNLGNVLNTAATSGVSTYRAINLIDTSGVIKIARLGNNPSIELQEWDNNITNLSSYWDIVSATNGTFQIRDRITGTSKAYLSIFQANGSVYVLSNTISTNTSTGSLILNGGLGANGNIYATAVYSNNSLVLTSEPIANAAFDQANIATQYATSAGSYANSAYLAANTNNSYINGVNLVQNTNITIVGSYANSAYTQANTANTNAATSNQRAVTSGVYANAAYSKANTADINALSAGSYANSAYTQSNNHNTFANNSFFLKSGGTITGNVTITKDLVVTGNITITGNSTAISANNLIIDDSIIYLGNTSTGNTSDIGIVGHFTQGVYQHTGIARDATDGKWKFFSNVASEPSGTTIDFTNAFYDTVKVGIIETDASANIGSLTYIGTNFASPLGGATNPILGALQSSNNYVQVYILNANTGTESSSDFAAYPDNGNDASGWIDVGITSSTYASPTFSITKENEGYIFVSAPSGAGKSGNLVIATDATGVYNSIEFYLGGFAQTKGSANVKFTTQPSSTSTTTGAVIVKGGLGVTNNLYADAVYDNGLRVIDTANAAASYANSAYNQANTANQRAVTSGVYANAAYTQANTATTNAATADQRAVTSGSYANSAFTKANTADQRAVTSGVYANAAYTQANTSDQRAVTSGVYANSAYAQANNATNNAAVADQRAVTSGVYANAAYIQANTADQRAVTSGVYANAAYGQANTATTNAATADQKAVSAGSYANGAFIKANTATTNAATADQRAVTSGVYANSAYTQANTATTNAATADQKAVSAGSYANSAYTSSNTKFASAGGTISGDVNITGNLIVSGETVYANTTTLNVGDSIITLNADIPVSQAPTENAGVEIDRGSSANTLLLWNETTDKWTFTNDGSSYSNIGSAASEVYANAAYSQANTATTNSATADQRAVTSGVYANAAYTQANTATTNAATSDQRAVTSGAYANAAYGQANTASINATSAGSYANGAFARANTSVINTNGSMTGILYAGTLRSNTTVTINTHSVLESTSVTTASTAQITVDSFATASYRSAKYLMQVVSGTAYQMIELSLVHDNTTVYLSQYGEVRSGANLGTFDASITTGTLNILFTPVNSVTTVKAVATLIPV